MCARRLAHSPSTQMHSYILKGMYSFAELLFQCMRVLIFLLFFLQPSLHNCFHDLECARPRALRGKNSKFFRRTNFVTTGVTQNQISELSFWNGRCLWDFEMQKQQLWQYGAFKSRKKIFYLNKESSKINSKSRENPFFCVVSASYVFQLYKKVVFPFAIICVRPLQAGCSLCGLISWFQCALGQGTARARLSQLPRNCRPLPAVLHRRRCLTGQYESVGDMNVSRARRPVAR